MSNFNNDILSTHNKFRKNHGAPSLRWSSKLESDAQRWANKLAKNGYLQHENQSEQGENIAVMRGSELTGSKATEMWYEEIKDYNFKKPGFNSKTGHFTQVVWVNSLEIGVGKATASNGMQFVVARYSPPGNMLKRFPENVFPSNTPYTGSNNNNNTTTSTNNNNNRGTSGGGSTSTNNNTGRSSNKEFSAEVLRTHNLYRKRHKSPALKWSSRLAKAAENAAEEAAKTNTLRSVDMSNVGQNMAVMTNGELTGARVSTMWYEEESKYNYDSPGFSSSTGSFSQLAWKSTTEIGVGRAFGSQKQTFVVALYSPPGNIRGKYEENVQRPSGPPPDVTKEKGQGCGCVIL